MAQEPREPLRSVRFRYADVVDFADPDCFAEVTRRLTNAAYRFNHLVVTAYGGRAGPEREPGLVEQAIAAAFQSFCGEARDHRDPCADRRAEHRGVSGCWRG